MYYICVLQAHLLLSSCFRLPFQRILFYPAYYTQNPQFCTIDFLQNTHLGFCLLHILEPPRFVSVTFLLVLTNCLILCLSHLGTCQFVVLPAVFVFSKPLGSRLAYSYLFQPVISLIWKSKGESRYIRLS